MLGIVDGAVDLRDTHSSIGTVARPREDSCVEERLWVRVDGVEQEREKEYHDSLVVRPTLVTVTTYRTDLHPTPCCHQRQILQLMT